MRAHLPDCSLGKHWHPHEGECDCGFDAAPASPTEPGSPPLPHDPDVASVATLILELQATYARLDRLYAKATSGKVRKTCYWVLGCIAYHLDELRGVHRRSPGGRSWALKAPWNP